MQAQNASLVAHQKLLGSVDAKVFVGNDMRMLQPWHRRTGLAFKPSEKYLHIGFLMNPNKENTPKNQPREASTHASTVSGPAGGTEAIDTHTSPEGKSQTWENPVLGVPRLCAHALHALQGGGRQWHFQSP